MLGRTVRAAVTATALALTACGSDEEAADTTTTTIATSAGPAPLTILVTNDDGIGAPGIAALVLELQELDAVEIVVVAPAENQSGSSDKTTPGGATHADTVTTSGIEGTAVVGFPADAIAVAIDELEVEPDLVVSGINEGQNVGPLAYVSGTVGAARAAVRRGIPAVAGSAGLGESADYVGAAELVVAWIVEHRDGLDGVTGGSDAVVSFNVPGCTAGATKELLEVPLADSIPEGVDPFTADCTIEPSESPGDDVIALAAGHASVSLVPAEAPRG